MPPKKCKAKNKLHKLAIVISPGTVITDTRKQKFVIEEHFAQGGFGRIYSAHLVSFSFLVLCLFNSGLKTAWWVETFGSTNLKTFTSA